jgi:hypothetical protein
LKGFFVQFTFHWSELLFAVLGGIVLFFILALLMLRRREEILRKYFTPEESDIEHEFFRVQKEKHKEKPDEEDAPEPETEEMSDEDAVRWGVPTDGLGADENA